MSNLDLFSGKDKAEIAIDRLRAFCPPEGYYVAFSGGKDSVVILDLVKRSGVPFDAHYNFTSVDPPKLVRFIKTFPTVEIRKPELTMWQLIIKKRMPPTRVVRYCCEYLKEGGGQGRRVVTGIRWAESYGRSKRKMVEACFRNDHTFYVRPIIDWSSDDVWGYIKQRNLKYCTLYDEGFRRIGCIGCPMAGKKEREKQFARWPNYKKAYIKSFDRCIQKRNADGLQTDKWSDGNEMFAWWVNDSKKRRNDDNQVVMFE
jgi:phosphoadenosine phosphosulfate reductase